jgi:hypothetical protein
MSDTKKKNVKLDLVKRTPSLKKLSQKNKALEELREKIAELGDISELSDPHPDLVEHFCTLVENISKVVLKGPEKKALVLQLLLEIFPILNNDKDCERIERLIDHVCNRGLIKKISDTTVLGSKFCSFIKKSSGVE